MTASPFAHVLAADTLPPVLRRQFLDGDVVLGGSMDTIWHRPRWVRPLLAALARRDVLFPETGTNVAAELRVTRDHAWRRTFAFERERRFDAELLWDGERVVERTGPFDLAWDVAFLPPDRIEIRTCGCAVRLGTRSVALPRVLVPDVRAVERALDVSRIHVELVVRLWPLGAVFGYRGTFEARG